MHSLSSSYIQASVLKLFEYQKMLRVCICVGLGCLVFFFSLFLSFSSEKRCKMPQVCLRFYFLSLQTAITQRQCCTVKFQKLYVSWCWREGDVSHIRYFVFNCDGCWFFFCCILFPLAWYHQSFVHPILLNDSFFGWTFFSAPFSHFFFHNTRFIHHFLFSFTPCIFHISVILLSVSFCYSVCLVYTTMMCVYSNFVYDAEEEPFFFTSNFEHTSRWDLGLSWVANKAIGYGITKMKQEKKWKNHQRERKRVLVHRLSDVNFNFSPFSLKHRIAPLMIKY